MLWPLPLRWVAFTLVALIVMWFTKGCRRASIVKVSALKPGIDAQFDDKPSLVMGPALFADQSPAELI